MTPGAETRPLVLAHRGASEAVAEHTLGAYEQAIVDGADGLECDVRLTADGHLVCVHDRTIDRTSDGRGVVSTLELAELQDLDFASWKDGGGEMPDVVDERHRQVLTLPMLLELVLDHDRPLMLAIETKHPTRYAGWVEQRTAETLERYGLHRPRLGEPSRIRLMSFSVFALRRFGRAVPDIPRVALMDRVPVRFRDGSLPVGVEVAGPAIDILREHPRYASRVRSFGRRVFCWTVDDDSDVDVCVDAQVDAIITNRPRAVIDRLDRLGVG